MTWIVIILLLWIQINIITHTHLHKPTHTPTHTWYIYILFSYCLVIYYMVENNCRHISHFYKYELWLIPCLTESMQKSQRQVCQSQVRVCGEDWWVVLPCLRWDTLNSKIRIKCLSNNYFLVGFNATFLALKIRINLFLYGSVESRLLCQQYLT